MTVLRSQWDRVLGGALIVVGFVALIIGYHGVSTSAYVADELSYVVSGGIGGLFLLGVGGALLLTADLHDEWRKLDRIEEAIRSAGLPVEETWAERELRSVGVAADPPTEVRPARGKAAVASTRAPSQRVTARTSPSPKGGTGVSMQATPGPLSPSVHAMPATVSDSLRITMGGALLGFVGLLFAYTKTANVAQARPAIEATAGACVAVVFLGVVVAMTTMQLKRRITLRQVDLLRPWIALANAGGRSTTAPTSAPDRGPAQPTAELLVVAGGHYAHRSGCPMLDAGGASATIKAVSSSKLPAGVTLCGLCDQG
jgi:hypothetical protein